MNELVMFSGWARVAPSARLEDAVAEPLHMTEGSTSGLIAAAIAAALNAVDGVCGVSVGAGIKPVHGELVDVMHEAVLAYFQGPPALDGESRTRDFARHLAEAAAGWLHAVDELAGADR